MRAGTTSAGPVLRYGEHPRQYLHLVAADGPAVVWVHGGFWRAEKDAASLLPACEDLAAHAIAGASVEYRTVEHGGRWPHCAHDVAASVTAFWAATGIPPARTVLAGHSAGGHLAMTAARELPQLGAVAALAAVSDLVSARAQRLGDDAVDGLLGEHPGELRAASPLHTGALDCRVLLVHGDADQAVPYSQSVSYAQLPGARARLVLVPGARHMHLVKPERPAWQTVRAELLALLRELTGEC